MKNGPRTQMGPDTRTLKACKHWAKSKAKQKNVQKESVAEKDTVPGHRLYLDLSKVTI